MIPLAILCAVLAALCGVGLRLLFVQGDKIREVYAQIAKDAAIHADAFRLLRDPRARGKNVRHSAWLTEVDELCRKWRGEM